VSLPDVTSHDEWLAARKQLLTREKELTRARDALSADRRRLPMVRIDKPYVFEGPDGEATLLDFFEGRQQLFLQHFMFDPSWEDGCPSCSAELEDVAPDVWLLKAEQPFEMPGMSCFLRVGDDVFHTYSTFARGTEQIGGAYAFLDLTALGRQEDWEEPKGRAADPRGAMPNFAE
jgi:predicted dithiol-disulfide oxidoreductase (DUF899 family)